MREIYPSCAVYSTLTLKFLLLYIIRDPQKPKSRVGYALSIIAAKEAAISLLEFLFACM